MKEVPWWTGNRTARPLLARKPNSRVPSPSLERITFALLGGKYTTAR